jgi:hypothetical protein
MYRRLFQEEIHQQLLNYIKNLEASLAISKDIIATVATETDEEHPLRKAVSTLNKENALLQDRVKIIIKERDLYQRKLLIAQQMVNASTINEAADQKLHIINSKEELMDRIKELVNSLDYKEYLLQVTERDLAKALTLLKKYALLDKDAKKLLSKLNVDKSKVVKISSTVEENKHLKEELEKAKANVEKLGN